MREDHSVPMRRRGLRRGARIGAYVVEDLLAQGSFGAVYGARHAVDGSRAAVKILHEHLASRPEMILRFEREIDVIQRLHHPNVVQILEHSRDGSGAPFLVMELLDGITLGAHMAATGPLIPRRTLEILEPLAAALEVAHAAGVIHRDVKPSNVFLAAEGGRERVVLLDFGVAKLLDTTEPALTGSREIVGTLTCMSPEQLGNRPIDGRTDVYGLGVLAFRMLAGELPFLSNLPAVLREMHLHVRPPQVSARVSVSPAFDEVLLRAMSKAPADRHPTVGAFLQAFKAVACAVGATDPRGGVTRRAIAVHAEAWAFDDADGDEGAVLETTLQDVQAELHAAGLSVIVTTGASVLLSLDLPPEPVEEREARRVAVNAALAVLGDVRRRAPTVRLRLSCHVGEIVCTPTGEAVGGDLLDVTAWAEAVADDGVFGSPEALAGLDLDVQSSGGAGGSRLRIHTAT
jgi:serine/threonine-protein kinase